MKRQIAFFFQDADSHWVAQLSCDHTQHVRHRPPQESRPWVVTVQGRTSMLGKDLDCLFCDMPALPAKAEVYKATKEFDEVTVPKGLLSEHKTKAGVWGRICVQEGLLLYEVLEPTRQSWTLREGVIGIIEPTVLHRVKPVGSVRFLVEFLKVS